MGQMIRYGSGMTQYLVPSVKNKTKYSLLYTISCVCGRKRQTEAGRGFGLFRRSKSQGGDQRMKCAEIKVIKKDGTREDFNVQKVVVAVNKSQREP